MPNLQPPAAFSDLEATLFAHDVDAAVRGAATFAAVGSGANKPEVGLPRPRTVGLPKAPAWRRSSSLGCEAVLLRIRDRSTAVMHRLAA